MIVNVTKSFEKHIEPHLRSARNYKYWCNQSSNEKSNKSMKKVWKSKRRPQQSKVQIDEGTIDDIMNTIHLKNECSNDFLESFCHKYTNINSKVPGGFSERMTADIEKREKKQLEIEKAEELFKILGQKPLDNEEKDECHNRLYTDAFYRAHKLTDMMQEKEAEDMYHINKNKRTASKKRIDRFVNKVNSEINENQKILDQKRRIKHLKEEIEFQKIRNRSVSKGKVSKSREREIGIKMREYENRKWTKHNNKLKQKEYQELIELEGFFKPKVSESTTRLAMQNRSKGSKIITGGVVKSRGAENANQESTVDLSVYDSIFDRLYNEAKTRKLEKMRKSANQTEYSVHDTGMSFQRDQRSRSQSKKRVEQSFRVATKVSPLTSTGHLYPDSPKMTSNKAHLMMNKYITDSSKAHGNYKNFKNSQKYHSNGAVSPVEFITWNDSKYNSQSIDKFQDQKIKDEERQMKLMQPISRHVAGKNINSFTNETLNSGDVTQDYEKYISDQPTKRPKPIITNSRQKAKNVLAYSLLDRSLDNTINLIESARKNQYPDLD
jgi:hypothetical protein